MRIIPYQRLCILATFGWMVCAHPASAESSPAFVSGDRWAVLGDSITHTGFYHREIELFYLTRSPGTLNDIINCGAAGDTSVAALRRLDWDCLAARPTVVSVMLGMNDVPRSLFAPNQTGPKVEKMRTERAAAFDKSLREITRRLLASGARVILIQPSIFDDTAKLEKANLPGLGPALEAYAKKVREIAAELRVATVDFSGPMTAINREQQLRDPSFSITGLDRVHPGKPGHLVMAYLFLQSQAAPGLVSSITIEVAAARAGALENASLSNLVVSPGKVSFTATETALPFPVDPAAASGLDLVPFTDSLNRQLLKISGLAPGSYRLAIDEQPVRDFTAEALAAGVNLAEEKNTPQMIQASAVRTALDRKWDAVAKQRIIAYIESYAWPDAPRPFVAAAMNEKVKARLAKVGKSNPWVADQHQLYFDLKPREAELPAIAATALAEARRLAKPLAHRFTLTVAAPAATPLKIKTASASSEIPKYPPANAIDGKVSDVSRWVSENSDKPAWLIVDLGSTRKLAGIHLFTGYGAKDVIEAFNVEFWSNGKWTAIPSAEVRGNKANSLALAFDQTVTVETDKLRLWIPIAKVGSARVKEIVVWPSEVGDLPPLPTSITPSGSSALSKIVPIYLNQSGFNLGKPKRFTAPTLADGTRFIVRAAKGGEALAQGVLKDHKGDFSDFNPAGDAEYVVEAGGLVSVPFRIGPFWLERVTYQGAVDFMIDSRHYVGNDRAKCRGSYGWRDDHHFAWALQTLVPQYLSNPSAYERMPRQVKYEAPTDKQLWGALEPYQDDAPDIVKLIHWGADIGVTQGLTHEMLKSQLAYFLYAWPVLKQWLPEQNYKIVRDFAFKTWDESEPDRKYPYDESKENNLLTLKTKIGSTKGALPPGFSVEPNLMMYEVAKRENRLGAEKYFKAAYNQVEWMVKNLDWNDPLVTKGQRMSEFITVTGLSHFLREYPDQAPKGLANKLNEWAKVIIRRSDNLWDFRKLDDAEKWTPMGERPQMWNEPGNVIGLPAPILAAREFITDAKDQQRLDELVWSHFDNMFGRNPVGRHFSYDAPREIEGVEHGWYKFHVGGIGRLVDARFVIEGAPKDAHYPYHPEKGDIGWTEGWIQFNTAFDISLAYLAWSESKIDLTRDGDELVIRLQAPLNFDYGKVETGIVTVFSGQGDEERVTVTEDSSSALTFTGRLKLQPGAATKPADKSLQFPQGTTIKASHGFGYLGRHATLKP